MSLTSKIQLYSRHTKKDGTQAIIIRFTLNRKSFEISTGYSINPKYWNASKSEIKPACPDIKNVRRLNLHIRKMRIEFEDKIIALQESGKIKSMTTSDIRKSLLNKTSENESILSYCQSIIDQQLQAGRIGNARVYKTMQSSIKTYLNGRDIPLRIITYKWLNSYEAWYLGKGNGLNGLSVHLRTLRAVLNRAIKEGILSKDSYAFSRYVIKSKKTKKRAISRDDLKRLKAFEPQTEPHQRSKDYFLMSFYLMGASFIDLAFLKMSNIINGRVEYRRRKTGQLHSIKITPALQDILDKYTRSKSKDDFILNVIRSTDKAKQYVQVRDELRRYNRRLKELGELCDISQTLTSYVSRHTWASQGNKKGVPISVISQSLGHSDIKTTTLYLSEFDNDVLDKYNEFVINDVDDKEVSQIAF